MKKLINKPIGNDDEEFKQFETELLSTITKEHASSNLRAMENYLVFNNADFQSNDSVLEFGACFGYGGLQVAGHVKEIIISDSFDWIYKRDNWNDNDKKKWMASVDSYNLPNVTCNEIDIQKTEFEDKEFDKIISYGSFEHVVDDKQGLAEMCRILKGDGKISMTIDFTCGDGEPFNEVIRGRVYNKIMLETLVNESPLKFLESPFYLDGAQGITHAWLGSGNVSIIALAIVLIKR